MAFVIVCTGGHWQMIGSENTYVRPIITNYGISLDLLIGYNALVEMVKCKIEYPENIEMKLSFQHPDMGYVMHIKDDSDIAHLQRIISTAKNVVYLYVENALGNSEDVAVRSNSREVVECSPGKRRKVLRLGNSVVDDSHIRSGGGDKVLKQDCTTGEGCTGDQVVSLRDEEEENLMAYGVPINYCKRDSPPEESYETEEDYSDDEHFSERQFPAMVPIPPDPVVPNNPKGYTSSGPNKGVKEKMKFESKDALIVAVGIKCIEEGYEIVTTNSSKTRYEAVCRNQNECSWRIYASVIKSGHAAFQVRTFNDIHECSRTQVHPNHKQGNRKVLGHLINRSLGANIGRVYRCNAMASDLMARYNISLSYKQVWAAKEAAFQLWTGSGKESFSKLHIYLHNLKLQNPGTVTYIKTDANDQFESLFFAIGCTIRMFRTYCRRVIMMDGAHLKGEYKGTVLHAVGMDGANQIVPVGYGICRSESLTSWSWFLEKLHECVGNLENLCFVTDRLPAIATAINSIFPKAQHVICDFHLAQNVTTKFKKNKKTNDAFWEMVKAYKTTDFDFHFAKLREVKPLVAEYLSAIPREKWTRSYSHGMRYNYMTSNSAESLNSVSKDARRMPITSLLEFFRATMQRWFYQRKRKAAATRKPLTKWAEDKIDKKKKKTNGWRACAISDTRYQVDDFICKEVVDFSTRTCTCRKWQLSGLPCGHVSVAATFLNQRNVAQFAISEFHVSTYRLMYEEAVNPLPAEIDWEQPNDNRIVKAPIMAIRQTGRPKNTNRIPSQGEVPTTRKCGRCGQPGHTRTRCSSITPLNQGNTSRRSVARTNNVTSNMNGASTSGTHSDHIVIPTIDLSLDLNNFPLSD